MTESLTLKTVDGIALEAELDASTDPRAALVLCHPHPQMGGTMNAPLLTAVKDHLVRHGWAVLRFNFRGIGASGGTPSVGLEEVKDAEAAVDELCERFAGSPVAIAGWSFGAAVAIRVTGLRSDLVGCVGIAPAIKEKPGITAGVPAPQDISLKAPTHLIVGVNDDLVDPDDCEEWALATGASVEVMPGANHFFWAKYDKLAAAVLSALDGDLRKDGG